MEALREEGEDGMVLEKERAWEDGGWGLANGRTRFATFQGFAKNKRLGFEAGGESPMGEKKGCVPESYLSPLCPGDGQQCEAIKADKGKAAILVRRDAGG